MTRLGKRTKRGAFDDGVNSLRRYYINNYQDIDKQVGIDALLGYIDGTSILGVKSVQLFKQQVPISESVKVTPKSKAGKNEKVVKSPTKASSESKKKIVAAYSTTSANMSVSNKMKTMLSSTANTVKENVDKFKKQIVSQSLVNGIFTNNNNSNSTHSSSSFTRTNSITTTTATTSIVLDVELDDILLKLQQSVADLFK